MPNNIALLTQSHKAIAAKKKAKREQIKEIKFDDEARREFLTGFHKRKLAKTEAARARAKQRERQERLETRREQRRMLREKAIENAAQVEKAYGAVDNEEKEWTGMGAEECERDEEYEDEEMLATVTVVEDFDPDTIIHGPPKSDHAIIARSEPKPKPSRQLRSNTSHQPSSEKKSRRRKIPYETSDARKKERAKQRARRSEKAELAGGKAARKVHGVRKARSKR